MEYLPIESMYFVYTMKFFCLSNKLVFVEKSFTNYMNMNPVNGLDGIQGYIGTTCVFLSYWFVFRSGHEQLSLFCGYFTCPVNPLCREG